MPDHAHLPTRVGAFGDFHLGQGVERYGPARLDDQAQALNDAVDLFVAERCDLVLFAGDGFERRRYPSQSELLAFDAPMRRLRDAGIPVVGIAGNHDVLSADGPTSVDLFADVMHVASRPTIVEAAGVAVACLPWTPISRLVAARNGGDRDALYQEAAAYLHSALRGLRADCERMYPGLPAVALGHWSVSGAVTPTGREVGLDFGVVLDAAELEAMGWDAVVVGHIHKAQNLNVSHDDFRASGPMLYTGSPLPLNHGEAEVEHGVWILETEGGQFDVAARFVPIKSRPFVTATGIPKSLNPPMGGDPEYAGMYVSWPADSEIKDAIIRLRYTATEEQQRRIDHAAIKAALLDAGASYVSIEPDIVREDRARVHIETDQLGELDALQLYLDANAINGSRGVAMVERTSRYLQEQS